MSDLFLLSERQMARISPFFPLSHGVPRVDDRRVVSGIIYVIRNGLQWKDAPKAYGPHKTLYNHFVRWSLLSVFDRIFVALATEGRKPERIMICSASTSRTRRRNRARACRSTKAFRPKARHFPN
jgi:transposase